MDPNEIEEKEKHFDEPPLEDFLPNEEEEQLKEQHKRRRSLIIKIVAAPLVMALIIGALQIWPQVFNLPSLAFLQKSEELSKQEKIQQYKEAVVTIQDPYSKGTGFNVSSNGFIITNKHVIDDMNPITVIFPNGEFFNASILYIDSDLDLAFLEVEGKNLSFLPLSKRDSWQIEEHIYVIGNPLFYNQIANEGKILDGSAKDGVLILSSPVYKGNSGSPVINATGDVIGVVYAKSLTDDTGFAIPIEQVIERLPNQSE